MDTIKLSEMDSDYTESERAEIIGLVADLRDVFDWPVNITDIKSPLYYSEGGIVSCPVECLSSMIAITKERVKVKQLASNRIIKSKEDAEIFFGELANPKKPNEALKKAAKKYKIQKGINGL